MMLISAVLWGCCSATIAMSHRISPRMVDRRCSEDGECGGDGITCDRELKLCKCRQPDTVLSAKARTCIPARQLGEECAEDVQCRLLERNASCAANGFCACDSGFYLLHENNGTLCSPEKNTGGGTHGAAMDLNAIIILSVLAFMFVGICVALHLFSKARFRNMRTIFNSPHPRLKHIKLGKGARKKSSVHTHHLPLPPGAQHRHHSFSGSMSPHTATRVSKTRSHECLRSALSQESVRSKFESRPKTAPLARYDESLLPSREELEGKTPDSVANRIVSEIEEDEEQNPPGSPTVIITDAEGSHTVVTTHIVAVQAADLV